MPKVVVQTVQDLVDEGLGIVQRERIRPGEAARRVISSPSQLSSDEVLSCIERAIGDWIEEALSALRTTPRFNVLQDRRVAMAIIREEDLRPLEEAAVQAARKLDALYCSQSGEMKPLSQFSVSDHEWRADYAAAQAKTWSGWAQFHRRAATSLEQAEVEVIADLPEPMKTELEGFIP